MRPTELIPTPADALVPADMHSHVWAPEHLSAEFLSDMLRAWPEAAHVDASYQAHSGHARLTKRSIVLAFDAPYIGFVVPDEFVAAYVKQDETRLVGFCSIDPMRRDVEERLKRATEEFGLRGVKLAPTYQGFDPLSREAFRLYELIAKRNLPIVWHQGVTFARRSVLAYAFPHQVDEVAIRYPDLRIAVAHLGHPWIDECVVLIRKHPNVFADISALTSRPFQMRQALLTATEYRCGHKLLFGSDFPFDRIDRTVDALADIAREPTLADTVQSILNTDGIAALGLP